MSYQPTIDKEIIVDMPRCQFPGNIVIISNHAQVKRALAVLKQAQIVGFDTETRPVFIKGVHSSISLLQLSTEDVAFLFRLKRIGPDRMLRSYLQNEKYLKIGLSVHDDFLALNQWMPCAPKGFIDLQKVVPQYGIEEMSLRKINAIVMGENISKREQLSNWDNPILTKSQMLYAATDAWACIRIYNQLLQNKDE